MSRPSTKRTSKPAQANDADDHRRSLQPATSPEHEAALTEARAAMTNAALPAIADFREYMAEQNRKLEVTPYLDHIEGPQVVVTISRADGRIIATLMAEVTDSVVQPSWDVTSTGRVKTHWVERIPGGLTALTRENVFERLKALYLTDFS